ncbi:MAG: putative manganese-dependent inorganic diphosphatase [Ruminococcus sp.]|nr:putative manganese-dependent inorganic diphosphatase [Ruminococcus sp.]
MQTFIFGHKNPDTDSVCSSIALSYLLNEEGKNTVPKVLGHINLETKFALDYFKVKCPDYLNDTKVQIKDVKYNKRAIANENSSISKVFSFMQKENITAIPLVNDNKKLVGFVTLKEIAKYLISGDKQKVETSFSNILESLNGTSILEYDEEIKGKVLVASYQSKTFHDEIKLTSNDILVVGDRYKIIEYAIASKVKLIILTGNHELPKSLLKKAEKNKVNIIISKYNSFETVNKVILSNRIKSININEEPCTINSKDYRTDFLTMATKEGHTNYPIINNKRDCLGLLKVTNADNYQKQKVILVDHNSFTQSAIGIEEAEITEIIDHHNLSSIDTFVPINFRSMPVGCTCTIIYSLFMEKKIAIPKHIAGLMLSAILSDTLIFKSPTTTDDDKFAASKLAKIAKVNIDEYGYAMFKAASSIKGISVSDLINGDFKTYSIGNYELGISQVMTMDFNDIAENIDEYINKLDEMQQGNYLCVVLFITDIYKNGSYVIYNKNSADIIMDAFNLKEVKEGIYLKDVVSRKKQMLPALLEVIGKRV